MTASLLMLRDLTAAALAGAAVGWVTWRLVNRYLDRREGP